MTIIDNAKMNAAYSIITYHNPHLQVPLQLARQRKPGTHVGVAVDVGPGAAQLCIGTSICDSERLGKIQCTQEEYGWLVGWLAVVIFLGCFAIVFGALVWCVKCPEILQRCMDLA